MRSEKITAQAKILTGRAEWAAGTGRGVSLTCPECGGPVAEIRDRAGLRYRCQVGHGYSLQAILVARLQDSERSLRHLASNRIETASLSEVLARQAKRDRAPALARKFRAIAKGCWAQLAAIQKLVLELPDGNVSAEVRHAGPRK